MPHPDCLIVGGGVIGLSIAYELAGRGREVRVIDRQEFGREASWAGAGILPPPSQRNANHPLDQLHALSFETHARWHAALREETGVDNGYRNCGAIYLARTAGEAASLFGTKQWYDEHGVPFERIDEEELALLEPALAPLVRGGQLRAAYRLDGECQIRNPRHLQALAAACRQRGVECLPGVEANGFCFQENDGRVTSVRTTEGLMTADRYCLTSGPWTRSLLEQLDTSNGLLPIRGQMVLFRCAKPPFRVVLNEGPRYLVAREDGRVLVGSTEEEVGFDKSTTDSAVAELIELARGLVPALREAEVERTWAGLRPASFDGFPYLGQHATWNNVYVAAGHFRSGLLQSTGTALVMADLLCGATPSIDLTPFSVTRG